MRWLQKGILIFFFTAVLYAEKITIRFWELCLQEEILRPLLNEFEALHPNIQIELERLTWSNGLDKILIALSSNTGPDLCELGSTWVPQFLNSKKLVEVTHDFHQTKSLYQMWEPVEDQNGRLFGAPWLIGTRILFYRRDWLREQGFSTPASTLSEFLQHLTHFYKPAEQKWGYGIPVGEAETTWKGFFPYLSTIHGPLLLENRSTLSSNTALQAFSFYQRLKTFSLCDKSKNLDQYFVQGQLGYHLSGPWLFKKIASENPNLDYGITCFPGNDHTGQGVSFLGGEVLVLFQKRDPAKEEASRQLLLFLMKKENLLRVCRDQSNLFPALLGLEHTEFIQSDPKHRILYQQIQNARHPPCIPEWNTVSRSLNTHLERLLQKKETPEESLYQLHQEIESCLQGPPQTNDSISSWPFFLTFLLLTGIAFYAGYGKEKGRIPWFWLSPFLVVFGTFQVYPILHTFYLSLTNYEFLSDRATFVGLANYKELMKDSLFRQSFHQTLLFALITVPLNIFLGLLTAAFLDQCSRLKTFFRMVFFLPTVTVLIVTALIFGYLYEQNGLLNTLLRTLNLGTGKNWLMEADYALYAIMLMAVWSSFGYYTIFFLGGMKTISPSLYEAAHLDGATSWYCFWFITLPQLKPFILFAVLLNMIRSLQVFPEIFTMTQGGPENSTTTLVYYIYQTGFQNYQMGKACAASFILVGTILLIAILQHTCFRERT